MRNLDKKELSQVAGGKITAVTTTTQFNKGGNEPSGVANGVPIITTTVNENPTGKAPPGHN